MIRGVVTPAYLAAISRRSHSVRRPVSEPTARRRARDRTGVVDASSSAVATVDPALDAMALTVDLVAHDLRSPLAASRQAVDRLLDRCEVRDAALLTALAESLGRIDHMVEDLLSVERLQLSEHRQHLALDELCRTSAAGCSAPELVELVTVAAQVYGDPPLLGSAIGNLVENALRHATSKVLLQVVPWAGGALLMIDDDGPGVPPPLRELVFRPFVRLDPVAGSGDGLGLALVRRVVDLHGGRVWAEDAPRGGARFCVWLPAT